MAGIRKKTEDGYKLVYNFLTFKQAFNIWNKNRQRENYKESNITSDEHGTFTLQSFFIKNEKDDDKELLYNLKEIIKKDKFFTFYLKKRGNQTIKEWLEK